MTDQGDDTGRQRDWCFTLNNYTDLEHTAIVNLNCRYLCIGKETAPSTGTPHLQCYVYYDNLQSLKSLKKVLPDRCANIKKRYEKSTPAAAAAYCKKEGDFYEKGELPAQGKRSDLDNVRDSVKEGKGMREIVESATSYQSMKCAQLMLKYKEKKRDWKTEVIWIHGKAGVGKSKWIYDHYPADEVYEKVMGGAESNKWFEAYDAHPYVLLDEVDSYTSYSFLKQLCDRYPCRVEDKGGSRSFLAKVIVITSLSNPHHLFISHPENGKEMLRRIDKIIELPE